MKQLYKCEYCNFIGTEEEVKKHEEICELNSINKDCMSCKHKKFVGMNIECGAGKEIPAGKMYQCCDLHERKEEYVSLNDILRSPFGRFW